MKANQQRVAEQDVRHHAVETVLELAQVVVGSLVQVHVKTPVPVAGMIVLVHVRTVALELVNTRALARNDAGLFMQIESPAKLKEKMWYGEYKG